MITHPQSQRNRGHSDSTGKNITESQKWQDFPTNINECKAMEINRWKISIKCSCPNLEVGSHDESCKGRGMRRKMILRVRSAQIQRFPY